MKHFLLMGLLWCACTSLAASERWFAFTEGDGGENDRIGFRDAAGEVKIEPRFSLYMLVEKFDDIIAVMEVKNGEWDWENTYYLTKDGRRVGHGDMYVFDNAFDCENEGFIRFTQKESGLTGLFDARGDIAIPAEYNALSIAMNGMVLGLRNARLKQYGEHSGWEGGEGVLLTTENKILIENISFWNFAEDLDFHSVLKGEQPDAHPLRKSFQGADGNFYAFISFEREFRAWLKTALPDNFSKADLLRVTHEKIGDLTGETHLAEKARFVEKYYAQLHSRLASLQEDNYYIGRGGFFSKLLGEKYFDNCRQEKDWQYPIMRVVIPRANNRQDSFSFIRTGQGYELIDLQFADPHQKSPD
jgi:hypothetical protein